MIVEQQLLYVYCLKFPALKSGSIFNLGCFCLQLTESQHYVSYNVHDIQTMTWVNEANDDFVMM